MTRYSTNGITIDATDEGSGPPVVLCHGFPELGYSWRHQVPALAGAGFRVIAPDQRGYGRSDRPAVVEDYDIVHLTADLVGILDEIGEDQAVFVGHDWGSPVVGALALLHPDRVRGVVFVGVPHTPRPPAPPTAIWSRRFGDHFFYILYFQPVGPADDELGRDARITMARTLWTLSGSGHGAMRVPFAAGTGFLDVLDEPPGGDVVAALPWLTAADFDHFADEFARTGFTGGLNWYRNFDRNWELTEPVADQPVCQPALFVAGDREPVLRMNPAALEHQRATVLDLRGEVMLPGVGHWTQQEAPAAVSDALITFARDVWA